MGFWRGLGNLITFGAIDRLEAKEIQEKAEQLLEAAQSKLANTQANTQQVLAEYGQVQLRITSSVIADFVKLHKRIGKIDNHPKLREHKLLEMPKLDIQAMQRVAVSAEEIVGTTGAAAIGGAAAAAGAYGLAGLIGTASTGTAIGALSGAAATNATLAWLGGGALSVGGAGMAGGAMVLGGIALAPFALIAGGIFAAKAKEQLNEAENFYDKVEAETEKMATLRLELAQIQNGAELLQKVVTTLAKLLENLNTGMDTIISRRKKDLVKEYSREEWVHIVNICNTVRLLFEVLNTPLMSEEGAFLSEPIRQIRERQGIYERMGEANTPEELSQVISEAESCRKVNHTVKVVKVVGIVVVTIVVLKVVGIGKVFVIGMAVVAAIVVGGMIKDWLRKK